VEELFARYGLYLWLGSCLVILALVGWLIAIQRRLHDVLSHYNLLTTGVDAVTLPGVLDEHIEAVRHATGTVADLADRTAILEKTLRGAVQHVGLVRYNPFEDTGGDQSFSLALLNDAGDGIVISSLFARERTRVYAKPVTDRRSTYHLSDEEEQAILIAGAPGREAVTQVPASGGEVTPR
jgi:hypothetical protein